MTESSALVAALLVLTDGALGTVGVIGAGAVAAGAVGTICAVGAVDAVGAAVASLLGVALVEDSIAGGVKLGAGVLVSLTVLSVELVCVGVGVDSTGVSVTASAVFFCNICGRYGSTMPR